MKKILIVSSLAVLTLSNSFAKGFGKDDIINFCKDKPTPLIGKQFDGKKASKSVLSMVAGKYAYPGGGAMLLYSNGYYLLKLPTNHGGIVTGSDGPDLMASGGILGGCSKEQLSEVILKNHLNIKHLKLVKKYR